MPDYCTSHEWRRISRAPEVCRVKHARGSVIVWRGARWRVIDRSWNWHEKEWDYKAVMA